MTALLLTGIAFAADPATPATPATPPATTTPAKSTAPIAKAVFKDVDKNHDGTVDKAELANIADLLKDFNTYDSDKNGKLSEAEYKVWLDKPAPAAGAHAVFEDLDGNKDAALDKTELAKMADLVRDFNTVDTDKNGKLNKAEYTAWVEKQKQM